jgi:hypothetical protein
MGFLKSWLLLILDVRQGMEGALGFAFATLAVSFKLHSLALARLTNGAC